MAQHLNLPNQGFLDDLPELRPRRPSPLEQTIELSSSEYIQKLTTYTYSPPLSEGTTSQSDYTGPTGSQDKKRPSSITMELMSQLTAKNRLLAP